MVGRLILAGLLALLFNLPADAADLAAHQTRHSQGTRLSGEATLRLLVFGKEAKTQIWLVQDGKHYYLDRNGNGDLTDPDEKQPLAKSRPFSPSTRSLNATESLTATCGSALI